jgi:hypothetical protein
MEIIIKNTNMIKDIFSFLNKITFYCDMIIDSTNKHIIIKTNCDNLNNKVILIKIDDFNKFQCHETIIFSINVILFYEYITILINDSLNLEFNFNKKFGYHQMLINKMFIIDLKQPFLNFNSNFNPNNNTNMLEYYCDNQQLNTLMTKLTSKIIINIVISLAIELFIKISLKTKINTNNNQFIMKTSTDDLKVIIEVYFEIND